MKRPSDDEEPYGGGNPSDWGPWIRHDGGPRPAYVRTDLDPGGGFGDPVDYRTYGGRGIGRNFSPVWKEIVWYRLPAGHVCYTPIGHAIEDSVPVGNGEHLVRVSLGGPPPKRTRRDWILGLKRFIRDPLYSTADLLLGLFILAASIGFETGKGHPWAIVPIVALWVGARLWANRP